MARCVTVLAIGVLTVGVVAMGGELKAPFSWRLSAPVLSPLERAEGADYSVKDPTIVRHDGRWHLFVTVRGKVRGHRIDYVSFGRWEEANAAKRHTLRFLIQGVAQRRKAGRKYGEIPWQLGILTAETP